MLRRLVGAMLCTAGSFCVAWAEDPNGRGVATKVRQPQVRPFITDDARVVGHRLAQLEAWVRIDKEAGQKWLLAAYGPTPKLELTIGGVGGYEVVRPEPESAAERQAAYALPLLQGKYLFRPYRPGHGPGVATVVGTFLPVGRGFFRPPGYGVFTFTNVTQCFGKREDLLLHVNGGANYLHADLDRPLVLTWGLGTQVRTYKGFHLVAEVFSGDPYIPGTGTAWQAGFRHFFSDLVQVDMTVGQGIAGAVIMPFWGSAGIRLVTGRFARGKASAVEDLQ